LFVLTVVVLSATIVTLLVVPYAFVVARHPQRRFWGEHAPMGRVMLWLVAIFVPLGVVLGLSAQPVHTTVMVDDGPSSASPHPTVMPSRGR
jgi:ABC-type spermidine/putrescine transport system permease subunit II